MNHLKENALSYSIILVSLAAALQTVHQLPVEVVPQWKSGGQASYTAPREVVLWGCHLGAIVLLWVVELKKAFSSVSNKLPYGLQSLLIAAIAVGAYWFIFYKNTSGTDLSPQDFVVYTFTVVLITLGNYMGKIEQNKLVGIRTPWSLASEENWFHTHRFASMTMVLGGLILLAGSFALEGTALTIYIVVVFLAAILLPVVYSFQYSKR